MDINDFRSLATVVCFIALAGVFYWTYHPKRKKNFDDAAMLPFGEDNEPTVKNSKGNKTDNGEGGQ